ncbi:protein WVD2-like 5 isoform X2 [Cajanus cajan]|uniref:protein WVD2-like 5 isoform X2 n=1 Tax=Cajanus cajan TaxID=3821 RepID=UPI00098D8794|nr:protein WVD2-like 5 isoform X2 [Cajanus cajan]
MDPINLLPADDGVEVVHQNGVHDEPSNSGGDGCVSYDLDSSVAETEETVALNGIFDNFHQFESAATDNSLVSEIEESNDIIDGNNTTNPKEEEVKITDQNKQSRAQKGLFKNKNAKATSSGGVRASLANKSKTGKDKEASSVSNGTSASDSHPRQSIKSRSFNDRQTQLSKHPSKSDAANSEVSVEKTKPKSLKKGPLDKVQGEAESSFTNTEDAKPRKMGTLPNYGFSFKCGERAERRREFYNKLEERIQAKEVEKSNLQAKTKESQEAEIKMLRKSLTFKATPMPSFYQEPPPPKVELKKIPTTRAKSPKLGRKKDSANSESDGNTSSSSRLARLSLDEKVSESNPTKGPAPPIHQKKPQRRSLPTRLVSEKNSLSSSKAIKDKKSSLSSAAKKDTNLSNANKSEIVANEKKGTLSIEISDAMPLNVVPSDKPSEEESHVNGDVAVEENLQTSLAQESIAAEH